MSKPFEILVDNRRRFETGEPGGVWLPMPATTEQLHDTMRGIGITTDNPQDLFVNGYSSSKDSFFDIPLAVIKDGSIDELNYLGKLLEIQESDERNQFTAVVAQGEHAGSMKELINLAQDCVHPDKNFYAEHYDGINVPPEYRIMSYQLTAEPPEPKSVTSVMTNAEKPAEKLKEITDRLEQGISELFSSDRYREYLNVMSKFHNYSVNNTVLIAMQFPQASLIAGFNAWKNQFGRNVKKGEKGIRIIAPSPFKVKREMEKIDPGTQLPVMGRDGRPVTEQKEITIPAFKVVSVFDVSQTDGRELPNLAVDALTGDVKQYNEFFSALEKISPVPVGFEKIEGGSHGYYHLQEKRIAIKEGMGELQTLKTTIHEIAHAKLHDIDLNAPAAEQADRPDRRTREVEAESIAYTVCQHYGLDTSNYSFGYVAGWSSGKELSELKSSLETIRQTAAEIINSVDGHFAEFQKRRETIQPEKTGAGERRESVLKKIKVKQEILNNNSKNDNGEKRERKDLYVR